MKNKWLKWLIGIGGVSTFTLFLQAMDTEDQASSTNEGYVINEKVKNSTSAENVPTSIQEVMSTSLVEREQQLMVLDWSDKNWDVEYTNEAIIATPKSEQTYKKPAEQRTRRS